MNKLDRCESGGDVELHSLLTDEDFDDLLVVDPFELHGPSRRSDKELGRVLSILDELEGRNG